jgi:hypothetical protein
VLEGLFTPSPTSVAIINGRRYSDWSGSVGTQSWSTSTSARSDSMNVSSGSSAIASRCAERANRAAFWSGRNVATEPSGCR